MKNRLPIVAFCSLATLFALGHLWPPQQVQAQGPGAGKKKYVASATTTAISDGQNFLDSITINGGTAGVVTLYDIAASGCTGTPGSGKFATIEAIGANNPVTLFYDIRVDSGLCMVTAAATDLTVTWN